MSPNLGPHQKAVLNALKARGPWSRAAGWYYANESRTVWILEALLKRGLVSKNWELVPSVLPRREYVYRLIEENK